MRLILNIVIIFFFGGVHGQLIPPKAKPGKCYKLFIYFDKKSEWSEINCDLFGIKNKEKYKDRFRTTVNLNSNEMKLHQKELIKLGYNIEVTGFPDYKTIEAHNLYIKKKIKTAKKEAKRLKKAKRNASKKH